MTSIKNSRQGYTLIELLAVMIILISVGTIIASILVLSLRGGNKSTTTNEIRQSGNYAISQMSKMIAYAKIFGGVSTDGSDFNNDCVLPAVGEGTPTPDPRKTYPFVKITSFDGGETIFGCSNSDNTLSSNSAALINPATMNASCYFTCSQTDLVSPPTIGIHLTLKKKTQTNQVLLPEFQTVINFDTSVTLRNSQ
jgi:type II secretory pathway pseudopilin PulG